MAVSEFIALKNDIIKDITEYMKYGGAEDENDPGYDAGFEAGYTLDHIDKCDAVLTAFLSSLQEIAVSESESKIMEAVKTVVLALNELNAECDGNMIETDQREQLCELIISAANEAGLKTEEDITEEWREW